MDTKGIKSVLKHEEMYSGAANGNHTKTQRGADNVSLYSQGGGAGAGLILTSPEGEEFTYVLRFKLFNTSNNEAEYEAIVAGLRIAEQMGVKSLVAKVDSRLKVNRRKGNPSSGGRRRVLLDDTDDLAEDTLSAEAKKARAIKIKARQYTLINGILYKKSFLEPWLRCVGPTQAEYVVREIHEGSYGMHSGPRSMVAKAIRSEYYWPTMHNDARNIIIKSQGKVKFLIVVVDYFTKWIKVKPVATITGGQVKKFVWDNIVCRFGLPGEIISDNGK
ncbi:reverse transcriptase domain-containing protein [Tanacetum coccineum]